MATFLPGEPAPYVYQITYHDGDDQELMMPSTVRRAAVRSWQDIPANVCNVLAGLGGRTLAGDEAPAMSPQQDPAHEAVVSAQQPTSQMPAGSPAVVRHQQPQAANNTEGTQAERAQARRRRRREAGRRRAAQLHGLRQASVLLTSTHVASPKSRLLSCHRPFRP